MIALNDALKAQWASHIAPDINPVPSDQYLFALTSAGLQVVNVASKENAGGLVSCNCTADPGPHFGLDVDWIQSAEDLPHESRNEMDLKITFSGGKQADGSCQWNADRKQWQLDPTGKGWVDTGFTSAPVVGLNRFSSRFWSDGVHWSCLRLSLNGVSFTPVSMFQNLNMIPTNWQEGLHPQLQMECSNVPWFLRTTYQRVWVMASTTSF